MTALSPAKTARPDRKTKPVSAKPGFKNFLADDPIYIDVIPNEDVERERQQRLRRIVVSEAAAILALTTILILCAPFFRPVYEYYAINPARQIEALTPLSVPNMTNQAVLSWATTSVTEIMTIGFGDFETKLNRQRFRFTPDGWDGFVRGFNNQKIGDTFREDQLVLTTVPSDTAVIVNQGENPKYGYQWRVQVPLIMTYATNNNVTRRQRALIELTIIRVPTSQNPAGIAIETWRLGQR